MFIQDPKTIMIPLNHDYSNVSTHEPTTKQSMALDQTLLLMLKDLRKSVSAQKGVPPFVIFQDPSLEEMATQYPITIEEMGNISGVSQGKANRYGKQFLKLIADYVEEHEIIRPTEFVVKSVANKSKMKVSIIQSIDRKIPFEDIAKGNNVSMEELMQELNMIVSSGTKLNIDYYLDQEIDEYVQEDICDYFMEASSDSIDEAQEALAEDDISRDEIELMRIKFLSDHAN